MRFMTGSWLCGKLDLTASMEDVNLSFYGGDRKIERADDVRMLYRCESYDWMDACKTYAMFQLSRWESKEVDIIKGCS